MTIGMKIHTNTKFVSGVNHKEKGVTLKVEGPKGTSEMHSEVVLLSIGRRPFTEIGRAHV